MEKESHNAEGASASIDHLLETVAVRLKEARHKRKLTQKELAEKAGIRFSYIHEIESGKTNITLRTLGALAEALELDIRTLFPVTDSLVPSTTADDALAVFLDKTRALLLDEQRQRSELLTELQSVLSLRRAVETPLSPVQAATETATPAVAAKSRSGKRADRPGNSH
jgi:transcriptional regulator with XRE-family HTH domain